MDKSKRIILVLIVLLLIIGLLVIVLVNHQGKINKQTNSDIEQTATITGFTETEDHKTYYTIREIINNYILYMKQVNGDEYVDSSRLNMTKEEIKEVMQNDGTTAIKEILDEQYMDDLNITDDQIQKMQNKYMKNGTYSQEVIYNLNVDDVFTYNLTENITIALVDARINDKGFDLLIKLDNENGTYSLFLEDFITKYKYDKNISKKDININNKQVQENSYNSNININPSDSYIVSQYFSEYRMKMLNDTVEAYKLLDTEYSQKKYNDYESFENYVNANKEKIEYASINKYQVTEHDGTKEYVCIDNNGKYYIFIEENAAKYKVVLDVYTTDLPEFLEKYKTNDGKIKVGMNIQKIFEAINDEDYRYVYNKLDNTFKQNNFPTEESFEEYVKQNFAHNQLEYENCKEEGNLYMFDVTVTEGTESSKEAVRKTFVMKLLEGTDFVMSFNVN